MATDLEPGSNLASLRTRLEPAVWFLGIVLPVAATCVTFFWTNIGRPAVDQHIQSIFDDREKEIKRSIREMNEQVTEINSFVSNVKQVLTTEVASAYFFSKTYEIGDSTQAQDALEGWFYSTPSDHVTLTIFTTERHPDIRVRLNGGKDITIQDVAPQQQRNAWNDVDLSSYITAEPLTDEQYIGVPSNVNNISVIPIPRRMKTGDKFDLFALITVRHAK